MNVTGSVTERMISLPGGAFLAKRSLGDVWSYPNIHGDVMATANASGAKQGATRIYDPYGEALTGVPDNSDANLDYGWLGQYMRAIEHEGLPGRAEIATVSTAVRAGTSSHRGWLMKLPIALKFENASNLFRVQAAQLPNLEAGLALTRRTAFLLTCQHHATWSRRQV